MPPVFGPISPSPTRLWSRAAPRNTASVPSHSANRLHSSPGQALLDHHRAPARRSRAMQTRATAASASSTVSATTTPLPAASPSALTTIGAPRRRTNSIASAGVGEPLPPRGRDARRVADLLGEAPCCPRAAPPPRSARSSGSPPPPSRPPARPPAAPPAPAPPGRPPARARTAPARPCPRAWMCTFSATVAVPGLPGAAHSLVVSGEAAIAQASACSRPPEPTTSTRIARPRFNPRRL